MRIDIKDWTDIERNTTCVGAKLNLHLREGILDAYVTGYFVPDDGCYEIYPNKTQNHKQVEEIFYDWEQVASPAHWQSQKPYWFLFTHPHKKLPCVVEFYAYGWLLDDDYKSLD